MKQTSRDVQRLRASQERGTAWLDSGSEPLMPRRLPRRGVTPTIGHLSLGLPRPSWKSGLRRSLRGWSQIGGWCQLGVELVASFDEVGFDVDGELGEAAVALDFAESG